MGISRKTVTLSKTGKHPGAPALFIARAPLCSALIVLAILVCAGALYVYAFCDPTLIARELRDDTALVQLIGAGITLTAAVIAAFRIQVRGRTLSWRMMPLILFAVWQALSFYGCSDIPARFILYSHSPNCLLFILAASIPIALVLFSALRLHDKNLGWSASAMTGLAISAGAIVLLQFFHDFTMDPGDWSIHLLAMGIVVGSSAYVGQVMPSRHAH
jgi:hypothetical protein